MLTEFVDVALIIIIFGGATFEVPSGISVLTVALPKSSVYAKSNIVDSGLF